MKNKLIKIIKLVNFYRFFESKNKFSWRCELKENEHLILLDHFSNFYSTSFIDSLGSSYIKYKNMTNAFVFYNFKTNEIGIFDIHVIKHSYRYFKILS